MGKGVPTISDLMDLRREVQAEMRRLAQPVEASAAAQAEQRRPQASRSREELLKTKLDLPRSHPVCVNGVARGVHAEGRPSESGMGGT